MHNISLCRHNSLAINKDMTAGWGSPIIAAVLVLFLDTGSCVAVGAGFEEMVQAGNVD